MARVVVAEDDEPLNALLSVSLSQEGFQVTSVTDGHQAVLQLETTPPDLLLLDLELPGRSGWEICHHLEQQAETTPTKVVIFSADSSREAFDKARRFRNFAGYFVKPYAAHDVLRHITKVLGKTG